jgi:arylsulfotransferase ASST
MSRGTIVGVCVAAIGALWSLAAAGTSAAAGAVTASAGAVTISPLPGTPDAMPQTQISILGTAPSNIVAVTVTGNASGAHAGHLEPYSEGQGASFVLEAPLAEGEQVNVVVALSSGGPVEDDFTVARLATPEKLLEAPGEQPASLEHFKSQPELRPPKIKVKTADPSLEGDFFLDPLPSPTIHVGAKQLEFEPVGPNGLMILDPQGRLLWWDQLPSEVVGANLQRVTYEGQPAIAWWQGRVTDAAYGVGEGIIANSSYEPIAHVSAGNGLPTDIHELNITPQRQAFLDAYELECLPVCDAEHPPTIDAVVQEIDIHTGLVMWEWHAMGHIALSETEVPPNGGVWDPYHVNSIQPLPEHRLLISLRDTSGVYELDQNTGAILWQIAGKASSFARRRHTTFHFQHDARLEGNGLDILSVFADEAGPPVYGNSRGLRLRIAGGTVKLMRQYLRPTLTIAVSEGSTQVMRHGEAVVGFGSAPFFSEFAKNGEGEKRGRLLFDAELPRGDGSYRVLRFPWDATPTTSPALAAERTSPSEVALYASWNGATAVASWEVLAGESAETLAPVDTAGWAGFETAIDVTSTDGVFEVRALDKNGKVLSVSAPVTVP